MGLILAPLDEGAVARVVTEGGLLLQCSRWRPRSGGMYDARHTQGFGLRRLRSEAARFAYGQSTGPSLYGSAAKLTVAHHTCRPTARYVSMVRKVMR